MGNVPRAKNHPAAAPKATPSTLKPLKRFVTERFGAESSQPDSFRKLLDADADAGPGSSPDPACVRTWHLSQLRAEGESARPSGRKVAVVGSGPAGLACAHDLSVLGYAVTVFDALPDAGGMLRYGIPEYRLPRGVIDREVSVVERLGRRPSRPRTAITEERGLQRAPSRRLRGRFSSPSAPPGAVICRFPASTRTVSSRPSTTS